jgi:hypothetical protein
MFQAFGYSGNKVDLTSLNALLNLLLPMLVILLVFCGQMMWWLCKPSIKHCIQLAVPALFRMFFRLCMGRDGVDLVPPESSQHSLPQQQKAAAQRGVAAALTAAARKRLISIKIWCSNQPQLHTSKVAQLSPDVSSLRGYMKHRWVVTLLVNMFFFYPSIVRVAVTMLACIEVCGSNDWYWVMNTDLVCPKDIWKNKPHRSWPPHARWAAWVAIPSVLVAVAVPVFVIVLLCWAAHTKRLHDSPGFRDYCGFMFSDYKTDKVGRPYDAEGTGSLYTPYAARPLRRKVNKVQVLVKRHVILVWDAVVHIQTVLLVSISVVGMMLHEYYQTLILAAVFGLYLIFIVWLRPFRSRHVGQLQGLSTATLFATSLLMLSVIPPDYMDETQHNFHEKAQPHIGRSLIAVNVLFLVFVCVQVMRCLLKKLDINLPSCFAQQPSKLEDPAEGTEQQEQQQQQQEAWPLGAGHVSSAVRRPGHSGSVHSAVAQGSTHHHHDN